MTRNQKCQFVKKPENSTKYSILSVQHIIHFFMQSTTSSDENEETKQTTKPTTTSLTRTYSSVDASKFILFAFLLSATRTFMLQPLSVLLTIVRSQPASSSSSIKTSLKSVFLNTMRQKQQHSEGAGMKNNNKMRGTGMLSLITTAAPAFVLGMSISEAVYLCYFEYSREFTPTDFLANSSQETKDFISGFLADSIRQVMIIPFHVVATKQVLNRFTSRSTESVTGNFSSCSSSSSSYAASNVIKNLLQSERGIRSFFSGLGTSLAIGPLWTATWWMLYGKSKKFLYENSSSNYNQIPFLSSSSSSQKQKQKQENDEEWSLLKKEDNIFINTTASVFASATAAAVFNPFLVVRTRLMANEGRCSLREILKDIFTVQIGNNNNNSSNTTKRLWSFTKGGRLLFAGMLGTMAQAVVDGVGASLTYETAKVWAERK